MVIHEWSVWKVCAKDLWPMGGCCFLSSQADNGVAFILHHSTCAVYDHKSCKKLHKPFAIFEAQKTFGESLVSI